MEALGQPGMASDERYATRGPRMKYAAEINVMIEAWTRQRSTEEVRTVVGTF